MNSINPVTISDNMIDGNCFKCDLSNEIRSQTSVDGYNKMSYCHEHQTPQNYDGIKSQQSQRVENVNIKFEESKRFLVDRIKELIDSATRFDEIKGNFNTNIKLGRKIFDKFFQHQFQATIDQLETNLQMIERPHIKCVFVGKTSNGKSAVINALLRDKVLPSDDGTTTCCFISVRGCDEIKGYILDEKGKREDLDYISKTNETEDNHFNSDRILQLFYPKRKCRLLEKNVELIDSPGLDDINGNDEWIERYCADADVFVLVLEQQRPLSNSERSFLEKVKAKISRPNVIVLINKWDLTKSESYKKLRKQHITALKDFPTPYFVSAQVALTGRDEGFEEFRKYLSDKVSLDRFQIKVVSHIDTIKGTMTQVDSLMDNKNIVSKVQSIPWLDVNKCIEDSERAFRMETEKLLSLETQSGVLTVEDKLEVLKSKIEQQSSGIFSQQTKSLTDDINNLFDRHCAGMRDRPLVHLDTDGIDVLGTFGNIMDSKVNHEREKLDGNVKVFLNFTSNSNAASIFFVSASLGLNKEDQPFQLFETHILDHVVPQHFKGKLNSQAGIIKRDISSLVNTDSSFSIEDVTKPEIKSLVTKHFKNFISSAASKTEQTQKEILRRLKRRGFWYNNIDDKTEKLLKETLPNNLAAILSEEMEKMRQSMKALFAKRGVQDGEMEAYVKEEEYWDKVKKDFKSDIQREYLDTISLMKTLDREGLLDTIWWLLTWNYRKNVEERKTEYEKNYENLESKCLTFCNTNWEAFTKKHKEEIRKNLLQSGILFNNDLRRMEERDATLTKEKTELANIMEDIGREFS